MKYANNSILNTKQNGAGSKVSGVKPAAVILERAKYVLGTLLLDPDRFFEIDSIIKPFMFPAPSLVKVADVIWSRMQNLQDYDPAILRDETDLPDLIDELVHLYSNDAGEHAQIVRESYIRTSVTGMLGEAISGIGKTWDSSETMNRFFSNYDLFQQELSTGVDKTKIILKARESLKVMKGTPTGFDNIDFLTLGFLPGSFNVLGARPGMGKTLVSLIMAVAAIQNNKSVAYFSMEMSQEELYQILICLLAGVSYKRARKETLGDEENQKLDKAAEQVHDLPITVIDNRNFDGYTETMISKAFSMNAKGECDFLIADYLQLLEIHGQYEREDIRVGAMTRKLKIACSKMQIPGLILSQCNRQPEINKRIPHVSDLKNSGAIEADADRIFLIWRPSVYGVLESIDGTPLDFVTEMMIGKDRQFGENTGKAFYYRFYNGTLISMDEYNKIMTDRNKDINTGSQFPADIKGDPDEELPF